MPRAVLEVRAFLQQKSPRRLGHAEQELPAPRVQHSLLHHAQLDLQDLLQLLVPQRMKHHHLSSRFMNSGENFFFAASCAVRSTFSPACLPLVRRLHEAHAARHQLRDLSAAQVRRQKDHRLRQVHAPVVSQRQRRLIQDAQQQLPQRVRRLLDLIEQQKTQLQSSRCDTAPALPA